MEAIVLPFAIFFFNIYLAVRCGAFLPFWIAVAFFAPIVATPMLLYWNIVDGPAYA